MSDEKKPNGANDTVDKAEEKRKRWENIAEMQDEESLDEALQPQTDEAAAGDENKPSAALGVETREQLEEQLNEAEQQAQKNHEGWLRTQAELNNIKKRAEKDVANAHKYASEKFLKDLLPVLDSFEQGLQASELETAENNKALQEGMELTYKMLVDMLKKHGIEEINPQDEKFSPEQHEAMTMQEDPSVEANTVLKVFQKGYLLNGRLVRPARVVVAKS
jgi:molecular chaperone GrpE